MALGLAVRSAARGFILINITVVGLRRSATAEESVTSFFFTDLSGSRLLLVQYQLNHREVNGVQTGNLVIHFVALCRWKELDPDLLEFIVGQVRVTREDLETVADSLQFGQQRTRVEIRRTVPSLQFPHIINNVFTGIRRKEGIQKLVLGLNETVVVQDGSMGNGIEVSLPLV